MSPVKFEITRRRGIYRVTRDGMFHGDYTKQVWARESVKDAARELEKQGGRADIVVSPDKPRL
jgi:hypothetical protein